MPFGPERMTTRDTPQLRQFYEENRTDEVYKDFTFQYSVDELERKIADAEAQGKIATVKEHSYHMMDSETFGSHIDIQRESRPRPVIEDKCLDLPESERPHAATPSLPVPNPTLLPDRLLVSFTPVFIIRHPARMLPSLLRTFGQVGATAFDTDFPVDSSFKWQRMVYDCYKAWFGNDSALPIVIDGDKLINDPEGQMEKLCKGVGLDPAGLRYTWEVEVPDTPVKALFKRTLCASTGVMKGQEIPPVIDDEMKKWAGEWGDDTAQELKRHAEMIMPDYEYLLQRSI
ncbi:hypothetical protein V5O48_006021 [Marasmius crinis-equi]|uniref:Sulfotransferase n=1 Tax=Marasmius crinis-equi TaxID=585013 RepID=A0ABR3FKM3_9AGAR